MVLRRCLLVGAAAALGALLLSSCAAGQPSNADDTSSAVVSESPIQRTIQTPQAHNAGARTPSPSARTTGATVQHVFAPYDESGRLTAQLSGSTHTGTCWTTSIAVPIAGVYRCLADNEILDPCFAPAVPTAPPTLACFTDPWRPGTALLLQGPLPEDHPAVTDGHPWAISLANQSRCVTITGTVPTVHGIPVQYTCEGGSVAGIDDELSVSGQQLNVRFGPSTGPLHVVPVAAEWRGRSYRVAPAD